MRTVPIVTLLVLFQLTARGPAQAPALAGWPGVYPELTGYARQLRTATAGKEKTKEYRQTATYEWTGGDIRSLKVTLIRSSEIKQIPPKGSERVVAGKHVAWLLAGIVTVPLGADRAVLFEGGGSVSGKAVLPLVAAFPLDRIAKALVQPPRLEGHRSVEAFRALTKPMNYGDLVAWVGEAAKDTGSGIHIMVFPLPDGSTVLVGTPDFLKILYIKHQTRAGKSEDLWR